MISENSEVSSYLQFMSPVSHRVLPMKQLEGNQVWKSVRRNIFCLSSYRPLASRADDTITDMSRKVQVHRPSITHDDESWTRMENPDHLLKLLQCHHFMDGIHSPEDLGLPGVCSSHSEMGDS